MSFTEITIGSDEDFMDHVIRWTDKDSLYRGVRDARYELRPKAGRRYEASGYVFDTEDERHYLSLFKKRALPYLARIPLNDLEWLALAQHHGFPTRLLDWTTSPLVAAFFACEHMGAEGKDGAIFVWRKPAWIDIDQIADPFAAKSVRAFEPPHHSPRITAQFAALSIHPQPQSSFEEESIAKYVIKDDCCDAIKVMVERLGLSRASLFPSLDGLSSHLEWRAKWSRTFYNQG